MKFRIVRDPEKAVYYVEQRKSFLFIPYWSRHWEEVGSLAGTFSVDKEFSSVPCAEMYIKKFKRSANAQSTIVKYI